MGRLSTWTMAELQILAGFMGGRGPALVKDLTGLLPGKTGKQCRDRWYDIRQHVTQQEDGAWVYTPPPPTPRANPLGIPFEAKVKRKVYDRETLRWAARAALSGDFEAIAICGMLGIDMRGGRMTSVPPRPPECLDA